MKKTSFFKKINSSFDLSIQTRMLKSFSLIIFATVSFLEVIIISIVCNYYYGGAEQILKDNVTFSADFLNKTAKYSSEYEKANIMFSNEMASYKNTFAVQFIDKDKNLIMDSSGFSDNIEINTPDVDAALNNKLQIFKYKNESTGEKILAASRPLIRYNEIEGCIRFLVSLEKVDNEVYSFALGSIIFGVLIIIFFIITLSLISRSIIEPLKSLNSAAEEYAKGNFNIKVTKKYDDEVGRLADTMNFMSDEIQKTEKLKTEFISSISHELRTPLTSIKGWSETLQMSESYREDDEIKIGLDIISSESERLSIMLEELLDFSRYQQDKMKVVKRPVNIKDVLLQVFRQFSSAKYSTKVSYEFKGEDTIINADPNRLKQIYINLVTNAIKFTKEDGIVEIKAIGEKDKITTIVKDNGIGIKKSDLGHITEKFYKGSNQIPGNGLGLAIVDELVKLQDGEMKIESTENIGTTVEIVFPALITSSEKE